MTLIGVISDIHSNYLALMDAATLLASLRIASVFVCGDVVGYGRKPNACCDLIRRKGWTVVAGNHDWAVADKTATDDFNREALDGVAFNKAHISDTHRQWLADLPLTHTQDGMTFVHAALPAPAQWDYVAIGEPPPGTPYQDVRRTFDRMCGDICFMGHSHVPGLFIEAPGGIRAIAPNGRKHRLREFRAVVDVGNIGRPRGRRGRSCVVSYDTTCREVAYHWLPAL